MAGETLSSKRINAQTEWRVQSEVDSDTARTIWSG
jgi:hypothetical protein